MMEYCNFILQTNVQPNNAFLGKISFSEESRFTNIELLIRQNTKYWSQENRNLLREGNFQVRLRFNVWLGRRIISPIIFEWPLIGASCLGYLQYEIEGLTELRVHLRQGMYIQQDGVLPIIQEVFEENVISTNCPVRWPPRLPNLTPIVFKQFYLLKHVFF